MDNLPAADIIGASLGTDERRPHFDLAFRRAITLEHHADALKGIARMLDAVARQAGQQHQDAYRTADLVADLERETQQQAAAIESLVAERDTLNVAIEAHEQANTALRADLRIITIDRDNQKAAREAAVAAYKLQDETIAQLRGDLHRTLADLRTATDAATANAELHSAAQAGTATWMKRAELAEAELAKIRKARREQRNGKKRPASPPAKKAA